MSEIKDSELRAPAEPDWTQIERDDNGKNGYVIATLHGRIKLLEQANADYLEDARRLTDQNRELRASVETLLAEREQLLRERADLLADNTRLTQLCDVWCAALERLNAAWLEAGRVLAETAGSAGARSH